MSRNALNALEKFIPIVLGLFTIAAVLMGTGRILEKLDNIIPRVVQLEERVFGFHK